MKTATDRMIALGLLTRMVTDTGTQMFYAYLPIFAAGLEVSPIAFGQLISLRSFAGIIAPLFGTLINRFGYRRVIQINLVTAAVGLLIIGTSQTFATALLGAFVLGAGSFVFIPTMQSYASAALPDERRARGMGIIEYGWGLASIIGVFLVGQLLEIASWRLPFFLLSVLYLVGAAAFQSLPSATGVGEQSSAGWRDIFNIKENRRSAIGSAVLIAAIIFAAMHVFIPYAVWLQREYDFTVTQLGTLALAIGAVDLAGSWLVSAYLDRLGRRRSALIGSISTTVASGLLFFANGISLGLTLAVLLIARFLFEFILVAVIILASEQSPNERAKVMALAASLATVTGALAGLTGPWAYERFGVIGLSIPSAATWLICVALLTFVVRETVDQHIA